MTPGEAWSCKCIPKTNLRSLVQDLYRPDALPVVQPTASKHQSFFLLATAIV